MVLQNALPLMGQVATSPMIQGVVSNLVTSFLTPPTQNPPPPPQQNKPQNNNNVENNEIDTAVPSRRPQPQRPERPPQQQQSEGDSGSGLTSMLGQIVQTYLKHYFSNRPAGGPGPGPPASTPQPIVKNKAPVIGPQQATASVSATEEKADIVETISEVAKPFFISYFGVVPGLPGFGQLNIAERTGRVRDDTLTYDPDPGSSLTDLLFGSVNLPSTGNSVFDFGNRIAFAFSRANDPTQGMYCFKQYSVNKLWDSFRFGVRTLFK